MPAILVERRKIFSEKLKVREIEVVVDATQEGDTFKVTVRRPKGSGGWFPFQSWELNKVISIKERPVGKRENHPYKEDVGEFFWDGHLEEMAYSRRLRDKAAVALCKKVVRIITAFKERDLQKRLNVRGEDLVVEIVPWPQDDAFTLTVSFAPWEGMFPDRGDFPFTSEELNSLIPNEWDGKFVWDEHPKQMSFSQKLREDAEAMLHKAFEIVRKIN